MATVGPIGRRAGDGGGRAAKWGEPVPRIHVDIETLSAGGARQSAAGGDLLAMAGELQAAMSAAAAAVGDAGAGGAVGGWGGKGSPSPAAAGDAPARSRGHLRPPPRGCPETDTTPEPRRRG